MMNGPNSRRGLGPVWIEQNAWDTKLLGTEDVLLKVITNHDQVLRPTVENLQNAREEDLGGLLCADGTVAEDLRDESAEMDPVQGPTNLLSCRVLCVGCNVAPSHGRQRLECRLGTGNSLHMRPPAHRSLGSRIDEHEGIAPVKEIVEWHGYSAKGLLFRGCERLSRGRRSSEGAGSGPGTWRLACPATKVIVPRVRCGALSGPVTRFFTAVSVLMRKAQLAPSTWRYLCS